MRDEIQAQAQAQATAKQRNARKVVVDLLELSLCSANKAQVAINHQATSHKFTMIALQRQRDAVDQFITDLSEEESAASALSIATHRYRYEKSRNAIKELESFRQHTASRLETLVCPD